MFQNKKVLALIILTVSLATHFAFFGQPNQTVFDEVHFGKFVSGYLSGEYFFDIHPPLGKLLFYGIAYLGGFRPEFSFERIGESFPNNHYLFLRFLPTLAGALLPLLVFGIALKLRFSLLAAGLAGILTALDGALIAQSRFILLDAFLLLFGLGALWFYLKFRATVLDHPPAEFCWLWLAGISGALAGSIKWTGFGFLGLIVILELFRLWPDFNLLKFWKNEHRPVLVHLASLLIVPLIIYSAFFAIHFRLLPKSGPGDAFMSLAFQKTLQGNRYQNDPAITPIGFFKKITELNLQMYSANQRLTASHPYGSQWYTWPLLSRPIYFWNKAEANSSGEPAEKKIYLLGNPAVWWSSTVALLFLAGNFLIKIWKRKRVNWQEYLILGAYFLNLLPFIGVRRVMFLYHYFPSLIFALLGLAYLIDQQKKRLTLALILAVSAGFLFLYFAPLTYGFPLTASESTGFFWFPSWR